MITGAAPSRRLHKEQRAPLWNYYLQNVKDIQARQSTRDIFYTFIHNGHYECLDHIMVSHHFVRTSPYHIGYVEYVRTFTDHLIDETLSLDQLPRWQSDHGQVIATMRLLAPSTVQLTDAAPVRPPLSLTLPVYPQRTQMLPPPPALSTQGPPLINDATALKRSSSGHMQRSQAQSRQSEHSELSPMTSAVDTPMVMAAPQAPSPSPQPQTRRKQPVETDSTAPPRPPPLTVDQLVHMQHQDDNVYDKLAEGGGGDGGESDGSVKGQQRAS